MRVRLFTTESRSKGAWSRSALALFLGLVLLGGTLEKHSAGEALHESLLQGGQAGDSYSPEAIHPREQHHFEAGSDARRPVCPACLLHLLNAGAHTPELLGLAPVPPCRRLDAIERSVQGRLVVVKGAARAPPLV
jgi:hypothetical protein